VEQYLRAYCNNAQDNWAKLLPLAELSHNTHKSSATNLSPFEVLHGYKASWPSDIIGDPLVSTAEQRSIAMAKAMKETKAALHLANDAMQLQNERFGDKTPQFGKGDKVWLEGKNLKTQFPSAKLAPKHYGPFEIMDKVGQGAYKLKLPKTWRIHPVFHASLITPYKETEAHRPNYIQPAPNMVEGTAEFEVEEICNIRFRKYRNQKRWEYYIKWKGYANKDNTWEPVANLKHTKELIADWHRTTVGCKNDQVFDTFGMIIF
jgi:hypothetical protein